MTIRIWVTRQAIEFFPAFHLLLMESKSSLRFVGERGVAQSAIYPGGDRREVPLRLW